MSPKKESTGFTADEKAAMKERAKELKSQRTRRTARRPCSRRSPR